MIDILDMGSTSARQSTWRFELVDVNHQPIRELEIDRSSPPIMRVDVSRAVKRTLTGLKLVPGEIDNVDVIKHHLHVMMITDDGQEWPQGILRFSDASRAMLTSGRSFDVGALNLVDQLLIVDQQVGNGVSYGPGTLITDAIVEVLSTVPVEHNVQSSGAIISPTQEAVAWPAGTSRLRIVNELARMIGYHDLFYDNEGVGQLKPMPNPSATSDEDVLHYPVGRRTYRASVTRSTNILELPNKFVVVNTGVTNSPIYGLYEIPSSAPHSVVNRGFEITHVEQIQGIASVADADAAALSFARSWRFPFETLEFQGPPDPRHDHYNTVDFEGVRFLELGWSLPLTEGSAMSHTLRRTYEDTGGGL